MNYAAAIESRKSVREFQNKPVPQDLLDGIVEIHNKNVMRLLPEMKTELHIFGSDARDALEGAAGYHNFLVGAPHYMVLLSEKGEHAGLNAGFVMEDLVLKLSDKGLDSCWITFTDSAEVKAALKLESQLDVAAIVAFGYGVKTTKRLRLNILSMSNVDIAAKRRYFEPKRSLYDMVFLHTWGNTFQLDAYIGFYDDMLWEAFRAASLAPSYLNRQAYGFVIHDGFITLVERPDEYNTRIDGDLSLGIVLHHFTCVASGWAGAMHWKLGDEAAQPTIPEGHRAIASWAI